jgi:hypothetical protein
VNKEILYLVDVYLYVCVHNEWGGDNIRLLIILIIRTESETEECRECPQIETTLKLDSSP